MMTNLAPPQIRAITGLELAAGVFTKCSERLATQLSISLTSGSRDQGPTEFRIGINGDVYGGMLINACKPFAWRDQFAKTNVFSFEDRKKLQTKWGELLGH